MNTIHKYEKTISTIIFKISTTIKQIELLHLLISMTAFLGKEKKRIKLNYHQGNVNKI